MDDSNPLISFWKSKIHQKSVFKAQQKFINQLKPSKKLANLASDAHEEVFEKLDCLSCANCCKTIPPILNKTDINRISKFLNISHKDFHNKYVKIDEDGDVVMKQTPCPFLAENNYCNIYEARPKACRAYPHTDGYELTDNLTLLKKNLKVCPAAFHIVQNISEKLND